MKKRKILAVLLAVLMLGVLFVGCAPKEEKGENDIKISYWRSGLGIEFFNQVVADFERDTGYNVIPEVTSEAGAMKSSIELGLHYNNVDLYMFGSVEPSYYQYLEPLDDILTSPAYGESETIGSKYNTVVLEALKASDSHYYHLSYGGGWAGITYNADIIDGFKYKVPNTTTELETLVMQLSGDGIVPFIHFQGGGYWSVVYDIWQAQYDGIDYYNKTFLALNDGEKSPSEDVLLKSDGRKVVLDYMQRIITPSYVVNGSNGFKFTEAQTRYLDGQAAMMANGTWMLNEMKSSQGRYKNFMMMKVPVISNIIDHCDSISGDTELSALITAIDAAGNDKASIPLIGTGYEVEPEDLDRVYEARNIMFSNLDDHAFSIPVYATGKEGAKEFIRYFYSSAAMEKYTNTLHMKLPLTYANNVDTSSWNDWEKQQLSYNDILTPIYKNNPNKSAVFTLGGAHPYANIDFISSFSSHSDRKTADTVWNTIKSTLSGNWDNYLTNAGLAG